MLAPFGWPCSIAFTCTKSEISTPSSGKVCILKQDTAINQDLRGIIPKKEGTIKRKYLFYWFKSISNKIITAGLTQISVSLYDGPEQVNPFEDMRLKAGLNKEQFDIRKRWLPPEEHFGINLTNRAGANIMPDIKVNKLNTALKRKCFYPFYQLLVDFDGGVLLCNHDWDKRLILGNVKETSILNIWNSEKYKEVRENLANANRNHSPCNRCDANGMMMGGEFVNKWKEYYEG